MARRRDLLKGLVTLPLFGTLPTPVLGGKAFERDYFKELGVRTFINAAGTYTALTGSLPHPEVIKAINYAALQYVKLEDLQDAVGERIAELLRCEAAMVTTGAASAITFGTAAIMTGGDPDKIRRLPADLTGMKSEVIVQKSHRIVYDHAIRNCGVKIVEVETRKEMEAAINDNTAMMWFLNANNYEGKVQWEEFVAIAKKAGIPTFIDCAADVPPTENLWKFTEMGFDLVCFSGGKGLRGPQSAGLLLGRKVFIDAAKKNGPPIGDTIGRVMKVNKEEILGMLVALEVYLARDEKAEWDMWENQIKLIHDQAVSVPGVTAEIHVPKLANHVPSLRIGWNSNKVKITAEEARKALRDGHPSIETVGDEDTLGITTWMMSPGEERIVAKRVKEVLQGAVG
ncbi:MAG TPA: aminotransferase class V-fold PLP-dependent enzyme [Cyclobacteriaceae bacterium]|nr:aminotransferase class V-fold PLP-dependent enzyme [Cyclobacteriaceae bacterium]